MSFQCTRCGADVKDENGVLIAGKYYGPDCAARLLGLKSLPDWFRAGDWEIQLGKRNQIDASIRAQRQVREVKMEANWPLIHSISVAYHNARITGREWEISFLGSIATRLGMQFCKETAYLYNSFQEFISNDRNFPDEVSDLSTLSEKQRDVLNRIIG
jgi:hypothetical protein